MTGSRYLDLVDRINDYLVELPPHLHPLVNVQRTFRERHPTLNGFIWFGVGALVTFLIVASF